MPPSTAAGCSAALNRPATVTVFAAVITLGIWMSSGQDLQFFRDNQRLKIESRKRDGVVYYPLRDVARVFSLPWQERTDQEFLLRGPRGSITFFRDKPEIRVNGEMVSLAGPVWRRRGEQWYITVDFFDKALPRIVGVELRRRSATLFDLQPLPALLEVKIQISVFPDHTRLTLEPAQPADFQIRDAGNAVEITAARRRLRAVLPALPNQGFIARLAADTGESGALRVEKGPSFQGHREQTLENPFRKVVDFYGPPPVPATPPALPLPAGTDLPVLPPIVVSPGISSPALQPQKFVRRPTRGVIVLDAGHGGSDLGVHSSLELLEKNLTVALARQLKTEIEAMSSYRVVITREADLPVGILQRTSIANSFHAEAFVSLHFGGSYDAAARGGNAYFYADSEQSMTGPDEKSGAPAEANPRLAALQRWKSGQISMLPQSQALAAQLQAKLNEIFVTPDTRVGANGFLVLRGSVSPAVIVEAGYLTNAEDAQFLSKAENVNKVAIALAVGILDFLRSR
ncbi:MAG: N-acetylmuramoyl-L-alanine amidase [Acidobacteria bacterium]|nr:N-acetylmuramoyl-L-alanine amidase [Acidobacteriota bacterium]